jgi:uncharacterized protein YxeA
MDKNKRDKMNKRVIKVIGIIFLLLLSVLIIKEKVLCEYQPLINNNGSQMKTYEEVGEYYGYQSREPSHYNSKGIYLRDGVMYQKNCIISLNKLSRNT